MDLLLLLRWLTLLARGALLAALLVLLHAGRGGRLGVVLRPAWVLVSWVHGVFMAGSILVELQHLLWPDDRALREVLHELYNTLYLLNGSLDAALPLGLLVLFLGATRYRRWALAGLAGVAATGAAGIGLGVVRDWDTMMGVSQVLTFQGIAAYLVFHGLFLLKRIPEVDFYLAAFVAVDALFLVLLPIQEVIFQAVGAVAATEIWHLHQILQLAVTGVQVAIALSCINSMRYIPLLPALRVPAR
jgi:hypothetical protein